MEDDMDERSMICLHIPVTIALGERVLRGELSLPAHASEVRVRIGREGDKAAHRRQTRHRSKREIAALDLQTAQTLSSGDLLRVIDWVRSRRLLQRLPISLVLPSDDALAALKAAHHRPASVSHVFVHSSRHLTLAHSA